MKKGMVVKTLGLAALLMTTGCAQMMNRAENKGGLLTSKPADYVVINQSGGLIMDVYKLEDVIVSSPETSDGWIFPEGKNRHINLSGDVKVIRFKDGKDELWDKYHEYHAEFETQSYREKYAR